MDAFKATFKDSKRGMSFFFMAESQEEAVDTTRTFFEGLGWLGLPGSDLRVGKVQGDPVEELNKIMTGAG